MCLVPCGGGPPVAKAGRIGGPVFAMLQGIPQVGSGCSWQFIASKPSRTTVFCGRALCEFLGDIIDDQFFISPR